jgi:dipeptidyl aminopeptidase/acylaminoacyl peptidase
MQGRACTGFRRGAASCALLMVVAAGVAPAQASHTGPAVPEMPPVEVFRYDRTAPLHYRDSIIRIVEGIEVRAFRFASPGGGDATGLLFVPPDEGPLAGVLLQHGMPADAAYMTPQAVYLARHGAVVLALDAPFARRLGPPIFLTPADSAEQVQLIQDLQRATDVLLGRGDVDPQRLAYVGRSYGGAMGALLAGVERRLKTYILAVADGGLVSHTIGADGARDRPQGVLEGQWQAWLQAMQPIEPIRFVHRSPPASIFFQSAREDRNVPVADAEALHRAAGEPRVVRWYDTGHALDVQAYLDQLLWLHQTIGITPPGPEDEAGPDFTLRQP